MSDPLFEAAYQQWLADQIRTSKGERKRRLSNGLGYAEKLFAALIWWHSFGNLHGLHAEYEVRDFKNGVRFLDFAFIMDLLRICIEIDAFGTHHRDVDRWQFADNLTRQNDLVIDGWRVLRFSLDDIKENPRLVQRQLQQAIGKWTHAKKTALPADNPVDAAILRLLGTRDEPISPTEVSNLLRWHRVTINIHMKKLLENGWIMPSKSDARRNRGYVIHPNYRSSF